MRRFPTSLAGAFLFAGAIAFAPSALANSFAISIGVPGFAVGYTNHGGYAAAYAPPPVVRYGPPVYYAPAPAYYGARVAYGRVVYYDGYRPWSYHYYRHW